MYCDHCGSKLSYNAKYCRRCGQKLNDTLEDTQPLPAVNDTMLFGMNREYHSAAAPWYKSILPKKPVANRSRVGRIIYDLYFFIVLVGLLYIFTTFKTVSEYQVLTGFWGGFLLFCIWWKR